MEISAPLSIYQCNNDYLLCIGCSESVFLCIVFLTPLRRTCWLVSETTSPAIANIAMASRQPSNNSRPSAKAVRPPRRKTCNEKGVASGACSNAERLHARHPTLRQATQTRITLGQISSKIVHLSQPNNSDPPSGFKLRHARACKGPSPVACRWAATRPAAKVLASHHCRWPTSILTSVFRFAFGDPRPAHCR